LRCPFTKVAQEPLAALAHDQRVLAREGQVVDDDVARGQPADRDPLLVVAEHERAQEGLSQREGEPEGQGASQAEPVPTL
jgi:hypothetical protein